MPRDPDGGIDESINADKLEFDQIDVQEKRYSDNSIDRPTVQSDTNVLRVLPTSYQR